MKENFTIERLGEENFNDFLKLFQTVFDPKTSHAFLHQKYDTAYLGTPYQYMGYLAFNEQKEAVSYCGCIPFRLILQGEKFIAAHSCDHMTRRDSRGKGLFVQLNNKTDELIKKMGIPLVFGFPNQNNQPILVRYGGWEIIDTTKVFILPVTTLPLASMAKRIRIVRFLQQLLVVSKISKKRLTREFIQHENWQGIIRDMNFYSYKTYTDNYSCDFEHGRVWFKIKGALFIGDIRLKQAEDFLPLIKELKLFARFTGITKIIFISSSNNPLSKLFEAVQQPKKGNAIGVKVMDEGFKLDINQLQFTLGDYDTF